MFISHTYKTIFIHIQRTGGNSIQKVFEDYDKDLVKNLPVDYIGTKRLKHCLSLDIKNAIDKKIFDTYTKFCIVRNPYDRILSWYSMFKHQETIEMVDKEQFPELWNLGKIVLDNILPYLDTFEHFLNVSDEGFFKRFYLNQLDFITDNNGDIIVDKVLRFENLSNDFAHFAKSIGFEGELPHTNKSIRGKNYRTVYMEHTKALVEKRFKRDLEYFVYNF